MRSASMRRRLAAGFGALLVLVFVPPVSAQTHTAGLQLIAQTPWNSPSHPGLILKVQATNSEASDLGDLVLSVTFFGPLPTRSDYRLSLTEDVGTPLETRTQTLRAPLAPDSSQVFSLRTDVSFLQQVAAESRVYPLKVELISGGQHVAELRTPLIFLPEKPKTPLDLAWTFVVGHPIAFASDGTFLGRALEHRLEPGGSLIGEITALHQMATGPDAVPVDVVVSPTLVEDLERMQVGYRLRTGADTVAVAEGEGGAASAREALILLKGIAGAPTVELSAMPYGVPDLPQLEHSGLADDIPPQLQRGQDRIAGAFGVASDPGIIRPPGSSVDDPTLERLWKNGTSLVLLDGGVAQQPREAKGFAPSAVASLQAGADGAIAAIVPDDGIQDILTGPLAHDDPRLATQVVLGDLASIWLEQPDRSRAVAAIVAAEQDLPGGFFSSLVKDVATAPWIRTMKAGQVAVRFGPGEAPESMRSPRVDPIPARYLASIQRDRVLIDEWTSVIADEETRSLEQASLSDRLLLTEGSYLIEHERQGMEWLGSIEDSLRSRFAKVSADTRQVVTLTASGGRIPIRITNRADLALDVKVALISSRIKFPSGDAQDVALDPGETKVLTFDAVAQTTGTFPVKVAIETPSGRQLTESQVIVRSTAYNKIALAITLAALGVLFYVWARRSASRKKR